MHTMIQFQYDSPYDSNIITFVVYGQFPIMVTVIANIFVNGMKDFFNDLTGGSVAYIRSKLLKLHHYNTENFLHETDTLNHRKKWTLL